jgi:mannitol/fructose-specific phosphotransferase system IIA component (Ntr-type)
MTLRYNELFDPRHVVLDLQASQHNDAIVEIAERLRESGAVKNLYDFADAVMEREGRSSTNTGEGVAFPHARSDLVERIVLGIGRSNTGVRFGSGEAPVHLVFVLGVPQRSVTEYLVCVGTIARIVKPKERWDALMNAATAEQFAEVLRTGALLLE